MTLRPGLDFIGVNIGFLCHDDTGQLLFHLRSDKCRDEHNTWDAGGGRVQFGESIFDAARREIIEEYGCEIKQISHVSQLELFREHDGRPTHWLANIFVAHVDSGTVRIMEPEKNLGNAWHDIDQLPQPLHSAVALYIGKHGMDIRSIIDKHISK